MISENSPARAYARDGVIEGTLRILRNPRHAWVSGDHAGGNSMPSLVVVVGSRGATPLKP